MAEQSDTSPANAQSVIVSFRSNGDDTERVQALGQLLAQAIVDARAGVYDGHEFALLEGDDAYLFMYGPDAEALFEAVRPILMADRLMAGARVTLRFGSPDEDGIEVRHVDL